MKNIILHLIFGLVWLIGAIWAVVGFILYLVKDEPFNWNSVVLAGAGMVCLIINFIVLASKTNSKSSKLF